MKLTVALWRPQPLYHLSEREDRIQALLEARRVLKPGGFLFAAAITRWAAALDQLVFDIVSDMEFTDHVLASLGDGQHRSPPREPGKSPLPISTDPTNLFKSSVMPDT